MQQIHSSSFPSVLSSQTLTGTWKLDHGRALTLKPRVDAVLSAAQGGLWVTFSPEDNPRSQASGDVFIVGGESVIIPAGCKTVIEPWQPQAMAPAPTYFSWDAAECALTAPIRQASHWQLGVQQPLADIREGFTQVAHAFGALFRGLAGVVGLSLASLLHLGWMRKA